jgi:hypothetical protein
MLAPHGLSWENSDMGMSASDVEGAAAYSRISHIKDADQTGVERQDKLSLKNARRKGITVQAAFSPQYPLTTSRAPQPRRQALPPPTPVQSRPASPLSRPHNR